MHAGRSVNKRSVGCDLRVAIEAGSDPVEHERHAPKMHSKITRGCVLSWAVCSVILLLVGSSIAAVSTRSSGTPSAMDQLLQQWSSSGVHRQLYRDIQQLCVVREVDTPAHRGVREYIKESLRQSDERWVIEEDAFMDDTPLGEKQFVNVVATLPMRGALQQPALQEAVDGVVARKKERKRLVVAAHYDSKLFPEEDHFTAATDSAVPVAMMLDIARVLSDALHRDHVEPFLKKRRPLDLQLLFFDGEEAFLEWTDTDSLYGSRHLAARWESSTVPHEKLSNIEMFVLLDLIGDRAPRFHDYFPELSHNDFMTLVSLEKELTEKKALHYESSRDGVMDTTRAQQSDTYFHTRSNRFAGSVADDHRPFLDRDVPVLHLIPIPFPTEWHKPGDDIEHLHWGSVHDMTRLMRLFVFKKLGML